MIRIKSDTMSAIPERLVKILVLVTLVYFACFLWVFTQGDPMRLFSPAYWEYFWQLRGINSALGGRHYFYGASLTTVFVQWALIVGGIAAAYLGVSWVLAKKPDPDGRK